MTQQATPVPVTAVVLDIGETVLDRTREYAAWAAFFGVPAHTFSAVFGGLVARGAKVNDVIRAFADADPQFAGQALDELRAARAARGLAPDELTAADLYPDAAPTITRLRGRGIRVAVVGNQPPGISAQLRELGLDADVIASSSEWGVAKPAPEFFHRACAELGAAPSETVYVGDQTANDVAAPIRAGLRAVRIVRGPWGFLDNDPEVEAQALAVIRSLHELETVLP